MPRLLEDPGQLREQLGGSHLSGKRSITVDIIADANQSLDQIWTAEDPPAAQAVQSINLCQAVCGHKLLAELGTCAERPLEGKTYHLVLQSLTGVPVLINTFEVRNGALRTKDNVDLSDIKVNVTQSRPGEPVILVLVELEEDVMYTSTIIPRPLTDVGQNGGRITMTMLDFQATSCRIDGTGFKPNENLNFTSSTHGEVQKGTIKADSKGEFATMVLPAVIGQEGGICEFKISRRDEILELRFPWGEEALKGLRKIPEQTQSL